MIRRVAHIAAFCMLIQAADSTCVNTIDLTDSWLLKSDPKGTGLAAGWQTQSCNEKDWTPVQAGKRWEDQGFPNLDGLAWYRRWVEIPESWRGGNVWIVFGGINDAGVLFVNGERVNAYGDREENSVATLPVIAEVGKRLRYGERNLIAIQVYDWGSSGGLWRPPCLVTTEPSTLPTDALLTCYPQYHKKRLYADFNAASLGNERPQTTLRATLRLPDRRKAVTREKVLPSNANIATLTLRVRDIAPGAALHVEAALLLPDGQPMAGIVAKREMQWPAVTETPEKDPNVKSLNNFVTELVKPATIRNGKSDIEFHNHRDGWVFFSLSPRGSSRETARSQVELGNERYIQPPKAVLDDQTEPIVWRANPTAHAREAMLFLKQGEHRLTLENAKGLRLEIRGVPEIAYCYYPTNPHIACYGPYDWAFMDRYVLSDVNTLVTRSAVKPDEFQQWLREGRQWISNASLPGLGSPEPPAVEEVYGAWAGNPVVTSPGYAGLIVDEFCGGATMHYPVWGEAVKRLHAHPGFANKTFYAWCGDLFEEPASLAFSRLLMDLGDRFSWEKYLREMPTEEEARASVMDDIGRPLGKWKALMPGIERSLVVCLGYLSAPPETLNLNPSVDYHVFLDMQFQILATEPVFAGLYGVMEYMSDYADEESLRYTQELFRHYCIEGKRERYNKDPYILPHLTNPDFEKGMEGWKAEPAETGSMDVKGMKGFSWLEGRYPQVREGDRFCWMKRSAQRPNAVSQTARALEPGRLYSVKLISANLQQLDQKQPSALSIDVSDADILPEYAFQFVYPSSYSHEVQPYTKDHPANMSFHRLVFRPKGREARVAISDWKSPANPGAEPGQETVFNFVELQPFHAP
jgi:hypothetical protein